MEGKERTLGFVPVHAQTVPLVRSADKLKRDHRVSCPCPHSNINGEQLIIKKIIKIIKKIKKIMYECNKERVEKRVDLQGKLQTNSIGFRSTCYGLWKQDQHDQEQVST